MNIQRTWISLAQFLALPIDQRSPHYAIDLELSDHGLQQETQRDVDEELSDGWACDAETL